MTKKHVPIWLKGAVVVVIAAHLVLILAVIVVYGNNLPILDEWADGVNAGIAARTAQGQLTLGDLLVSYNGHRLPLTLSLTALNTVLFNYQPHLEMPVTAVLMLLNFCLMVAVLHHLLGKRSPRLFWLSLIPLTIFVFTGRWWESWAWGLMNLWQFGAVFTILGVLVASRQALGWRTTLFVLICCVAAAFSYGAGVLAFGVTGFILLARGERDIRRLGVLAVAGLFCVLAIFVGDRQGYNDLTFDPLANLHFIGTYLGAVQMSPPALRYDVLPDSADQLVLAIFGVGFLLATVNAYHLWRRGERLNLAIAVAFVLWGIGFATAVSIGRVDFYKDVVFYLDYHTPIAMQFWIGVFLLGLLTLQRARGLLRIGNIMLIGFMIAIQTGFTLLALLHIVFPPLRLDETLAHVRECPFSAVIGNNYCAALLQLDMVQRNATTLANLKLGPFANVERAPVPVLLRFLPLLYTLPDAPDTSSAFKTMTLDGTAQYVLFQHTARLAQSLNLPDLPDYHFTLRGALSLESTCADQNIQARLVVDDGQTPRIAIEQTASTDLVPFAIDLTDLRGRDFTLLYELETSEPLSCGHVLWANPRIEFSLTPQVP